MTASNRAQHQTQFIFHHLNHITNLLLLLHPLQKPTNTALQLSTTTSRSITNAHHLHLPPSTVLQLAMITHRALTFVQKQRLNLLYHPPHTFIHHLPIPMAIMEILLTA